MLKAIRVKKMTNKFKILFRMAILIAPLLAGIMGCGGSGGPELEAEATGGGKVATSEHYSLDRASVGTSFAIVASPSQSYEANTTIGHQLSDEVSVSDNYNIFHAINNGEVIHPL